MGNETAQIIITLFGGLAVFIYGMNLMSDGLQKCAGEKMKSVIAMLTRNPILGIMAGALCTAVLQSSSATTVMVVGFVSAGLMTLKQAISIILGANIGTTITAQLIAFSIGDYVWLFVAIGFVLYFFIKKEIVKYVGQTIFSFGLLFVGINIMGDTMKPLAGSEFFLDLMLQVQDIPALGVLLGTVMTVIVQSSSATIAVLQNLAATAGPDGVSSIIGLEGALPILFGDNIGTTITAVLASIGASVAAKRTVAAHVIFNVTGTLIFIWFIPYYADVIEMISPKGAEIEVISRQIANAHTCFNVLNTLWFIPLIPVLVKVVTKLIPEKEMIKLESEAIYLDENVFEQPYAAIMLATKELGRLGSMVLKMVSYSKDAFVKNDMNNVEVVMETEKNVNALQESIVNYLANMFTREKVTEEQAKKVSGLLHIAADIEHVGDHCKNIAEFAEEKIKNSYVFSKEAYEEIDDCFELAGKMVVESMNALQQNSSEAIDAIRKYEHEMNLKENSLRQKHIERINEGKCSPEFTVIYTDVIHNIEKIGDYCNNIADAVACETEDDMLK